jgi:excisionase family DNA binding protein
MVRLLTVTEVSDYLQLNPRTVLKMAQSGEIPAVKIARQWRFKPEWVESWLDRQSPLAPGGVPAASEDDVEEFKLAETVFTVPELLSLSATNCLGALREIVAALVQAGRLPASNPFLQMLYEREAMLSTGIGDGIAIPHPRHVSPGLFHEPTVVVARSGEGIEWSAIDGRPVHLVLLLMSPTDRAHLRLLSRLSRALKTPDAVQRLRSASSHDEVAAALRTMDQALSTESN